MLCLFGITTDGDPKIRFLLYQQMFSVHVVCIITVSGSQVHDFAIVKVERYLPFLRPLNSSVKGLLGRLRSQPP